MFTEFGACFDGERCATEITNSADAFDLGLSSWAYWMYKSFGDFTTTGGTKEGNFEQVLGNDTNGTNVISEPQIRTVNGEVDTPPQN